MKDDLGQTVADANRWTQALERQLKDMRESYAALDQRYQIDASTVYDRYAELMAGRPQGTDVTVQMEMMLCA